MPLNSSPPSGHANVQYPFTQDGGIATSGGASTLTDTKQNWTVNYFTGSYVIITYGTGQWQWKQIASNTSTALTIVGTWSANPDSTSEYVIVSILPNSLTSTGQPTNNVASADYTIYGVAGTYYAVPAPDSGLPNITPSTDAGIVHTTAFQNIANLSLTGGLVRSRGLLNCSTKILWPTGVTGLIWEGAGGSSTINNGGTYVLQTTGLDSLLQLYGPGTGSGNSSSCTIRDIIFDDGNKANSNKVMVDFSALLHNTGGEGTWKNKFERVGFRCRNSGSLYAIDFSGNDDSWIINCDAPSTGYNRIYWDSHNGGPHVIGGLWGDGCDLAFQTVRIFGTSFGNSIGILPTQSASWGLMALYGTYCNSVNNQSAFIVQQGTYRSAVATYSALAYPSNTPVNVILDSVHVGLQASSSVGGYGLFGPVASGSQWFVQGRGVHITTNAALTQTPFSGFTYFASGDTSSVIVENLRMSFSGIGWSEPLGNQWKVGSVQFPSGVVANAFGGTIASPFKTSAQTLGTGGNLATPASGTTYYANEPVDVTIAAGTGQTCVVLDNFGNSVASAATLTHQLLQPGYALTVTATAVGATTVVQATVGNVWPGAGSYAASVNYVAQQRLYITSTGGAVTIVTKDGSSNTGGTQMDSVSTMLRYVIEAGQNINFSALGATVIVVAA